MQSKQLLILIILFFTAILVGVKRDYATQLGWQNDRIGVMVVDGPLSYTSVGFNQSIDGILDQLAVFKKDDSIKGLVVRVNSPGGTVGASQALQRALEDYKAEKNIPIIISVADVCASGAYMLALGGDTIFAYPGSLVGSIGVIIQGWDFTQVPDRYGIDARTYKSGLYKDLLSSWRESTPDEQVLIQSLLDDIHSQFKDAVQDKRGLSDEAIARLGQGQIFTGRQAQAAGLVDTLGSFSDAVTYAKAQAGVSENAPLVYKRNTVFDFLSTVQGYYARTASVLPIPTL